MSGAGDDDIFDFAVEPDAAPRRRPATALSDGLFPLKRSKNGAAASKPTAVSPAATAATAAQTAKSGTSTKRSTPQRQQPADSSLTAARRSATTPPVTAAATTKRVKTAPVAPISTAPAPLSSCCRRRLLVLFAVVLPSSEPLSISCWRIDASTRFCLISHHSRALLSS